MFHAMKEEILRVLATISEFQDHKSVLFGTIVSCTTLPWHTIFEDPDQLNRWEALKKAGILNGKVVRNREVNISGTTRPRGTLQNLNSTRAYTLPHFSDL